MALTHEQLNEREKYGEWLSHQLCELCISCEELSAAIGMNPRTVKRYANGETSPSLECRGAIARYIQSRAEYDGFKHIPSARFAELLESLLREFKGVITQEQLARRIGKRQKNISLYTCCAEIPDTKLQRDILKVFYGLCKPGGGLTTAHFGTAAYLERLLYGDDSWYHHGVDEPAMGESASRKAVDFIMSMPIRIQSFLLDNFGAFFDHVFAVESGFRYNFSFKYMSYGIELFRQLSESNKKAVIDVLEKYSVLEYPETQTQRFFWEHISSYRNAVAADIHRMKSDREYLCGERERAVVYYRTESLLNYSIAGDDSFIEEVSFKLNMSSREWYVWMLFVMYEYAGHDVFLICNDMIDMMHQPPKFV